MVILCFATMACSEVKVDGKKATMHVDEYRWYITRIKTLEAENTSLNKILIMERVSFDELAQEVASADQARQKERSAATSRIKELEAQVRAYNDKKWIPGVVAGGGSTTSGSNVQGFIGLGWKVDIW